MSNYMEQQAALRKYLDNAAQAGLAATADSIRFGDTGQVAKDFQLGRASREQILRLVADAEAAGLLAAGKAEAIRAKLA